MVEFQRLKGDKQNGTLYVYIVFKSWEMSLPERRIEHEMDKVDVVVSNVIAEVSKEIDVSWIEIQLATEFIDSETAIEFSELKTENEESVDNVYFSTTNLDDNNVLRKRILGT